MCTASILITNKLFILHSAQIILFAFFLCPSYQLPFSSTSVKNLALRFGKDIFEGSTESTCYRTIEDNFIKMNAKSEWKDSSRMLKDITEQLQNMLEWKKSRLKRLAEEAEAAAANHSYETHVRFSYVNSKYLYNSLDEYETETYQSNSKYQGLPLVPNRNFKNVPVNFQTTAVHIPLNVYEEKINLKNALMWSDKLEIKFRNNKATDPNINWQYFCSATGFLRFFPVSKWRVPQFSSETNSDISPLDLYDCRLRDWYIRAAASPKDIVILLDGSGSMTGQRKEIAKNVVSHILDSLSDDDFVSVIRFSLELEPIVPCFGYDLVQATEQNVYTLKKSLDSLNTTEIADFSIALNRAFEMLQHANKSGIGSQCNQAIMLVTDGAPETFSSIFRRYNYPLISIRVFTYLVGKEVTDTKEVNLMACENLGYYTHVSSLSEVREQVQLYLPVMSRPLVLTGHRDFRFTSVYADITDVPLTPWVWEEREKERIRRNMHRKVRSSEKYNSQNTPEEKVENISSTLIKQENEHTFYYNSTVNNNITDKLKIKRDINEAQDDDDNEEMNKNRIKKWIKNKIRDESIDDEDDLSIDNIWSESETRYDKADYMYSDSPQEKKLKKKGVHELMTTISLPVFDTKNTTNVTERFLQKNVWKQREKEVRSANLLGVVGIDIPIREIVRLIPAYKLGVNGYSFVVNNNGFVLYHPDLRPLFQDLLKPFYSSADITEVELPVQEPQKKAREIDNNLYEMRKYMIEQQNGWKSMKVKLHLDSMKRAVIREHKYHFSQISGTPFSLAIVLPEPYGSQEIIGRIEVKRKDENYTNYFRGNNWRVHPDWVYCQHNLEDIKFNTSEDVIRYFLKLANDNDDNLRWKVSSLRPQLYQKLTCDRSLVESLVFDAKATDIDSKSCGEPKMHKKYEKDITQMLGITLTFIATRSGLSRFEDHRPEEERNVTDPFIENHSLAIEEVFYQRAVDFARYNSSAFVFSVPFDAGEKPGPIYVTGSRAIFLGSDKHMAPVAVTGLQFKHSSFAERFFNFTSSCIGSDCKVDCASSEIDCYLIDNNGFVVVSEQVRDTGKFFGEIDYSLFKVLLERNVYKPIRIYDYQAICIEPIIRTSNCQKLSNPLKVIGNFITFILSRIYYITMELLMGHISSIVSEYYSYDDENDYPLSLPYDVKIRRLPPNKTRPYPCDKEFDLYEMMELNEDPLTGEYTKCESCEENYIIQPVPLTNLIILVIEHSCSCNPEKMKITPIEITYPESCRYELRHVNKFRKRPENCTNYHPEEIKIKQCGKGTMWKASPHSFIFILISTSFHLTCIFNLLNASF